ncbi:Na+/H+ antiporter subunit B [Ectothiorhodospira sp. BSL-9]|uniref:Na+/H+ antiporter subunit B n=1 Tax=Ectothiorhodospira sp. BSL-9 TaxID=1442136 RepID=UPI0007B4352F|nr:Na+/H+ antiporter subunit B [Ectothiorhodospira sp. BSL-9]ANB01257.1 monovalent cation/H+ antiporter subunit B [Ectothiorhodospira sp. BSL-9]TVQ75104.1 MAG: Na+/H+ antiporter subunit B [Chromatiaceae bacterium]
MTRELNIQSLILRSASQLLLPLLLMFSVFLLLRGHDEPGGGFIAGLVAASAIALHMFAQDIHQAKRVLYADPRDLVGWGLVFGVISGVPAIFRGQAFFTSQWLEFTMPILGKIKVGTPLIFDIGVYLVVVGSVLLILLTLAEAED